LPAHTLSVYLYELGLSFGRDGKQTYYPLPRCHHAGELPDDHAPSGAKVPVAVNPSNSNDPNYDGVPRASNPPAYGDVEKDYKRRV
jgi:hypothetical protein